MDQGKEHQGGGEGARWAGVTSLPNSSLSGSSPAGSRDILRMDCIGERESKRREKETDIFWFTQKANKAPDMGLVFFTEATGALSMERRRRVPFFLEWRHTAPF